MDKAVDEKVTKNLSLMLIDLMAGDESVVGRADYNHMSKENIDLALKYLLDNPDLNDEQKAFLLTNSWKINYRDQPPTPQTFISEKYLGPAATHTYDRIKKVFMNFMDPLVSYRNLILYPHIGWGKYVGRFTTFIHTPEGKKIANEVHIGDKVCTPNGKIATVINRKIFPDEEFATITFSDKRTSHVGLDHFFKAAKSYNTKQYDKETKKYIRTLPQPCWKIITIREILKDLEKNPKAKWFIPITEPIYYGERIHNINPYTLGVVLGTNFFNKAIPENYLYDSIKNRISLLQGLLDTKGIVKIIKKKPCIIFSADSQIKNSFMTLVRGLGGLAWDKNDEIHVTFPTNDFPLFRLENKQKIIDKYFNNKKLTPQYLYIEKIERTENNEGLCIEIDDDEKLFLIDDYIVTHNSYLSTLITLYINTHVAMMRNPYKFFGLNPATLLTQLLVSYSLKKSSELLLEPLMAIMETSPFYEKVHTRESMAKREKDFQRQNKIDRIYWTTASPSADIQVSSGASIRTASSPTSLLGLSVLSGTMSELAFFRDAGKALALHEQIITNKGDKAIKDIHVGDFVLSPNGNFTEVIDIPWEGEDVLYEIEVEDGRKVQCNAKHLWPVKYIENGIEIKKIVTTQYMINNPNIQFDIQEYLL